MSKALPKLVALLLALSLIFVLSGTAFAASRGARMPAYPVCSQNGCNGLFPDQSQNASGTLCSSGATTLLSAYIKNGSTNIGLVELRWSTACNTNWTRVTSYIGTTGLAGEIERASGADGSYTCAANPYLAPPNCSGSDVFNQTTQEWTPQVWAPDVPARATGWVVQGGSSHEACVYNPGWSPTGCP